MSCLTVTVTGMSCTGCEQRMATALGRLDGVAKVEAHHHSGVVVVEYDLAALDGAAITQRLAEAGYELAGDGAAR